MGTCKGEEYAAFTGCATLSSYLILFISFYAATYKKASKRQKRSLSNAATNIPRQAAIDLKNTPMPTASETTEVASGALHKAEDLVKFAGTHMHEITFRGGAHQ